MAQPAGAAQPSGGPLSPPSASTPSPAASAARAKLRGVIGRVHNSVQVKRKYLIQSKDSKRDLGELRDKLVEKGLLKAKSRLDVTDIAQAALQHKRKREASDWALRYQQFCARFKDVVTESSWFKNSVTIAIFVAGINVGAQTYPLSPSTMHVFTVLDEIVLGVFVAECVLNIFAEGLKPWRYFMDGWNIFDFLVVVASFLPFGSGQIAILRLMRLLRLLKLVRALPKLRILVIGLLMSFQSIGYVMLMVFLLFYLWAVVGVIFLSGNDPVNFGNLHLAFLALWRSATGDDWTDMMYTAFFGCTSTVFGGGADYGGRDSLCEEQSSAMGFLFPTFYFIVFQVIASMMLINMFIGAILMSVEEAKDDIANVETLVVKITRAEHLPLGRRGFPGIRKPPDAFVQVSLGEKLRKTTKCPGTCDPEWNATIEFQHFSKIKASILKFDILDWDRFGRDGFLGHVDINTASIPPNKTVRFQAALEDAQKNEYPNTHLFVEIRKSVTHAIPEQAVDPDSRLQTIANRMVLAKMELHDLRTAVEKRRKREQEQRMKSWRSVRSIVSFTSFRSGASSNADDKKQSTWRTVSKNNLMPASKVSQQTLPSPQVQAAVASIHPTDSKPPVSFRVTTTP